MPATPVLTFDLPWARRLGSGKVREIYALGDDLLLVTSDRISAFDVVMERGIPGKGEVLTQVSAFWFDRLGDVVPHHMLSVDVDAWSDVPRDAVELLRGRAMRCRRCEPLPVEWVVRGYLTGSGWKDYQEHGAVSGVRLPADMQHASAITPPILTPSTKAESGHDEPISFERAEALVGRDVARRARDAALELYARGRDHAASRGIVIADTKFEFGLDGDELILIDECLTPDSSRFWRAEEVHAGGKPTSFDKQVLRDWLSSLDWDRQPPAPALPDEIVAKTASTYAEIRRMLGA